MHKADQDLSWFKILCGLLHEGPSLPDPNRPLQLWPLTSTQPAPLPHGLLNISQMCWALLQLQGFACAVPTAWNVLPSPTPVPSLDKLQHPLQKSPQGPLDEDVLHWPGQNKRPGKR